MDTKEFLSLVLPAKDNYVLLVAGVGKKPYNKNCPTLDACCATIEKLDTTTSTVYIAVGKHANNEETLESGAIKTLRKQATATWFSSLCVDLDVGEGYAYATQKEAAKSLLTATSALGLPAPLLVSSGNGVHAWWPLDTDVRTDMWVALSSALQAALQTQGVALDPSKVKDPSMVLRPAGSHHKKDPKAWKEVRVVHATGRSPVMDIATVLAPYKQVGAAPRNGAAAPRRHSAVLDAVLSVGAPIALAALHGCRQLKALLDSGGVSDATGAPVHEPLWRASLGVAKFCEDPGEAIVQLAGRHPSFDYQVCHGKMDAYVGTGPTTCAHFAALCATGCDGCPSQGRIVSPAQLSRGTEVTLPASPGNPDEDSIHIPGYFFRGDWLVYQAPDADEAVPIAPYNILVAGTVSTVEQDHAMVKLDVNIPQEGWCRFDIPVTVISAGGKELAQALSLKGVYIVGNVDGVRRYIMTFLSELQKRRKMQYFYKHFGWQGDGSFLSPAGIIGGTHSDTTPHFEGAVAQYMPFMQEKGDLDLWVKATTMFAQPGMEHHALVFLMMCGGFLLEGTGIASVLVNMYSSDSGSGKTTVGMFGSSIWGDPSRLQRIVTDTDRSLYKHFGLLHSLGAYIDEVTTMDDGRFRTFAFNIPEGREPERLTKDTTGFRPCETWRMPVFSSSNKDAYEVLNINVSSEAEKFRVLQFPLDRGSFFEGNNGYHINRVITQNYGHVGPMLVAEVLMRGGLQALMPEAMDMFEVKYDFAFEGPERFYKPMYVCADVVGELMESLGLINFDYRKMVRHGLPVVQRIRAAGKADRLDGLDLVGQFLTEHGNELVLLRVRPDATGRIRQDVTPPANRSAVARSEVERDKDGLFVAGVTYINSMIFKSWCKQRGAEYKTILRELDREGVIFREGVRKSLYKGVDGVGATGQTTCIEIDVASHPRMIESHELIKPANLASRARIVSVK